MDKHSPFTGRIDALLPEGLLISLRNCLVDPARMGEANSFGRYFLNSDEGLLASRRQRAAVRLFYTLPPRQPEGSERI